MELTLKEAQTKVDEWITTVGVRYFSELTNLGILMEEVGELSRLMVRTYGEQTFKASELEEDITNIGISPGEAEHYVNRGMLHPVIQKKLLADEMADVLWVLLCLANQTGVDLMEALQKNFEKKNIRDAERHKGNEKLK